MSDKTSLLLADFSTLSKDKISALIPQVEGTKVFIACGFINGKNFNTSLSEETQAFIKECFDYEFVEYATAKKNFTAYTNKFVVDSSDLLIKEFVEDLNLKGRTDVSFLRFDQSDDREFEERVRSVIDSLITRTENLVESLSDIKLLLSSVIDSFPDSVKTQITQKYQKAKAAVTTTMKISQSFIEMLSSSDEELSILDALTKFEALINFENFSDSCVQVLEKLNKDVEDFASYVEEKKSPKALCADRTLVNAVVITYGHSLSE